MSAGRLLDLIRAVGKRPGFYIVDPTRNGISIWHLDAFLSGYQCGRQPPAEGDDILDALTFWVCIRYGLSAGSMNWCGHLWRRCGEDEEAAFRLFFELFDEYLGDWEQLGYEGIKSRYMQIIERQKE